MFLKNMEKLDNEKSNKSKENSNKEKKHMTD